MKQEHGPEDLKTYNRGANHDLDREFLGAQQEGEYLDARNARPSSTKSRKEALEKINGEEIEDFEIVIGGEWKCVGATNVLGKRFSCWVDETLVGAPIIRIDDQLVLQSANAIFIDTDRPLQFDINESCIGGEVFITDGVTPPVILNVQDMLDAVTGDPLKYFTNFNLALYQINLQRALDIPVFIEQENVGAGGGLPAGTYEYAMRYVSELGDRTNFSETTPPIPIVRASSESSLQYPYSKTYGDDPNPESNTSFGIKLRFRVTNVFNYDFIEIKRIAHNEGGGLDFTPQEVVVAKIDIDDGEISVREFIDPVESNVQDVIPDDEATRQVAFIESAKTLRYFDKRLVNMNVKLASRFADPTFDEIGGKKAFAIKENIGKPGYNDSYNHTYKKHYMGGDKVGLGVQLFDGVGGKGFVSKIPGFENFSIPNRRDEIDANGEKYSYGGTVKAANSQLNVSQTHEIFDLEEAILKDDICSFKNIHKGVVGSGALARGFKSRTKINQDCDEDEDGEIENQGATLTSVGAFPYYHPYRPVSDIDSDVTGHNYHVNTGVSIKGVPPLLPDIVVNYQPKGFAPNYFSTGIAVAGVGNLPPWAKAFSIVRTDTAKRVVAQGLGMYSIEPAIFRAIGNKKLATKDSDKMWFFSPDIENGVTNSDTINDMIDNPEDYELQFVSPLGFFSEMYNFEEQTVGDNRDRLVDMIVYARMLRDQRGMSSQINPFEDSDMGISDIPFDGFRYIKHAKWRNTTAQTSAFNSGDKGNNLFQVESAKRVQEGRGNYMEITTTTGFYENVTTGGTGQNDFIDQGTKNFHEPFYIVNIVQSGREVRNQNIEAYRSTGNYQKIESIIGEGNGSANQSFILVDERWEDSIPALEATHPNAATDRFIYIRNPDLSEEKWVNVTFKSAGQVAAILNDISNNGFWGPNVKGIYRHKAVTQENVNVAGLRFTDRFWEIVFDEPGFEPQDEQQIIIKYDNSTPLRVFGGDSLIGESLFAPIDREANAEEDASETQFALGIGFPYRKMKLNPRHYVIKRTTGVDHIQDSSLGTLGYIRQMVVMFAVESRIAVHNAHNADYPLQYFPLINYVMRPNRWKDLKEEADEDEASIYRLNNIWEAYGDDYGDEFLRWKWGGFRFIQNVNADYSAQPGKNHISKPEFGFEEKTEFCTRFMHSLPRATNQQDSPGLRTFPANNAFDFDDDQGEIKFAYDERTGGKGENLYAVCEKGVVIALHKKSILSEITASDIGLLAADNFIQGQYWISKTIGCPDERWRGKAEGSISIPTEDGFIRKEAVFFPGAISFYRLFGNSVDDVAKGHYYSKIKPALKDLRAGLLDDLTAVYDEDHDEAWLSTRRPETILSAAIPVELTILPSNDGDLFRIVGPSAITVFLPPSGFPPEVEEVIICNDSVSDATIRNAFDLSLIIILQEGECARFTKQGNSPDHTWTAVLDNNFKASRVYVYGQEKNRFYGEYDYEFDRYININDEVFGLRDLSSFKLNQGFEINGSNIEAWVIQASALEINSEKEFIRYKAMHKPDTNKPTRVEFMDIDMNVLCALDPAIQGPLYLKNYDGSEQFIPRKDLIVSPTQDRLQDRVLLYKTFHNLAEDFVLKTTSIQFKILK